MDYKTHYENLINRARNRTLEGYKESHHIIPRCLGGTDERDNLVNLTAREHFIAHLLLWKINPESYGLIKAIQMMCVGHNENRSMNRMYGWLKERHSKAMSVSQAGESNSQFGTMWIHNLELKVSKKVPKNSTLEEGWKLGRVLDFSIFEEVENICICCDKPFVTIFKNKTKCCSDDCRKIIKSMNSKNQIWTPDMREAASERKKGTGKGVSNSQHDKTWMVNHDTKENKRVHKSLMKEYMKNGWVTGRVMKYYK